MSIALMSVMTAVLLQSFIVARRLNARASTEQRLQALAENTMESMKAADLGLDSLMRTAADGGVVTIGDGRYNVERDGDVIRLIYNDIGNGRGPVVSFGKQYGVICEIDPTPYNERVRLINRNRRDLVESYNTRMLSSSGTGDPALLTQIRVIVYRMETRLAKDGPEILVLESASNVSAKGGS